MSRMNNDFEDSAVQAIQDQLNGQLETARSPILGTVMSFVPTSRVRYAYNYNYGYGAGYGEGTRDQSAETKSAPTGA